MQEVFKHDTVDLAVLRCRGADGIFEHAPLRHGLCSSGRARFRLEPARAPGELTALHLTTLALHRQHGKA